MNSQDCEPGLYCAAVSANQVTYRTCQSLISEGEVCTVAAAVDGSSCKPGLKCAKLASADTDFKCYKMYALAEGASSLDKDLCVGGELNSADQCTSIDSVN